MKKITAFSLLLLLISQVSAFNNKMQYGFSIMGGSNYSTLTGGTDLAHANFYKHNLGIGALNFNARYFIDDKWSIQSGIGFTSIGFEIGFAKNYSLVKNDHYIESKANIEVTQIPVMALYNFKSDCKNKSWVIGAGFNFMFASKAVNKTLYPNQTKNENVVLPELSNLSQTINAGKFTTSNVQLMIGREKKFNKGNRISLNLIWNIGLTGDIAESSVNYTIDGNHYEHIFSNQGHYTGLTVSYLFSSKTSRAKANILKQL